MTALRPASLPAVLALALAASLAGCSPADPSAPSASASASAAAMTAASASPSASPSSSPSVIAEPDPVAAAMLVNGTGVTVLDAAGAAIITVAYTTPSAEAAAQLAGALDVDPTVIDGPGDSCHRAGPIYRWGGFNLSGPGSVGMVDPAVFSVYFTSTATDQGVALYGPGDVQVGDALADVRAQVPGATVIEVGSPGDAVVALETVAGGEDGNPAGVQTLVAGGAVIQVAAPVLMFDNC